MMYSIFFPPSNKESWANNNFLISLLWFEIYKNEFLTHKVFCYPM